LRAISAPDAEAIVSEMKALDTVTRAEVAPVLLDLSNPLSIDAVVAKQLPERRD